jgi:hypothetical protein
MVNIIYAWHCTIIRASNKDVWHKVKECHREKASKEDNHVQVSKHIFLNVTKLSHYVIQFSLILLLLKKKGEEIDEGYLLHIKCS